MYYKNENYSKGKKTLPPFRIQCTNCGSHDVTVWAAEYYDLDIRCNVCHSYLDCGRYNETTWKGNS